MEEIRGNYCGERNRRSRRNQENGVNPNDFPFLKLRGEFLSRFEGPHKTYDTHIEQANRIRFRDQSCRYALSHSLATQSCRLSVLCQEALFLPRLPDVPLGGHNLGAECALWLNHITNNKHTQHNNATSRLIFKLITNNFMGCRRIGNAEVCGVILRFGKHILSVSGLEFCCI